MCKPSSGLGEKNIAPVGFAQEAPKKDAMYLSPGYMSPSSFKLNKNIFNPYTATLPGRMAERFGQVDRQNISHKGLRSSESKFAF